MSKPAPVEIIAPKVFPITNQPGESILVSVREPLACDTRIRRLCAGIRFKGHSVDLPLNKYTEMEAYRPPDDGYAEVKIVIAMTPPQAGASPLPYVLRVGPYALAAAEWNQTTADGLQTEIGKKAINPKVFAALDRGQTYCLMPTETIEIHTCGRGNDADYVYFYVQIVEHGKDRRTKPNGNRGQGHLPEPFTDIPPELMVG